MLDQAGASLESLVKLTVYVIDIGLLREYGRVRAELLPAPPPRVDRDRVGALAIPGMMIEVEAIAVV